MTELAELTKMLTAVEADINSEEFLDWENNDQSITFDIREELQEQIKRMERP